MGGPIPLLFLFRLAAQILDLADKGDAGAARVRDSRRQDLTGASSSVLLCSRCGKMAAASWRASGQVAELSSSGKRKSSFMLPFVAFVWQSVIYVDASFGGVRLEFEKTYCLRKSIRSFENPHKQNMTSEEMYEPDGNMMDDREKS